MNDTPAPRPRRAAHPMPSPPACDVACSECGVLARDVRDPIRCRKLASDHAVEHGHVTAATFSQVILYAPTEPE